MIPFNKPFLTGKETQYIEQAVASGKISGDGIFTKKCHAFFEEKYGFHKVLLTTSCTTALEMAAVLINLKPNDEVIMPSYTFVSTANAFVMRGAKIIFADSSPDTPNIDPQQIEKLISPQTKAIVVVHYAGVACDMDAIMNLAQQHNLYVIEDAAHAINSYYKGRPLGSIGHLATFSFHETKNVIAGEGGMLVINNPTFDLRAEIIREKGTNRTQFFRGEINKYEWVDVGSSCLPSELIAAFLYAQLENLEAIQAKRVHIWQHYYQALLPLAKNNCFSLPALPVYATCNGHIFYIICNNIEERNLLLAHLKQHQIYAVFHYLSLHSSPYYNKYYTGNTLPNADKYTNCLVRLPLYYDLSVDEQNFIIDTIKLFYK